MLEVFDYRSSVPAPTQQFARKLHYAGSLAPEKAPFLQSWSPALNLTVYGNPNQTLRNQQAFAIHPPVHGDILPGIMQDGFGLVWDGDIQPADNEFGRYTRMNNPHKFSLYMAAGLPVIVWSEMAIATVVQRHQLGYVINSLTDLPALLNTVTAASYRKLQANTGHVNACPQWLLYATCAINDDDFTGGAGMNWLVTSDTTSNLAQAALQRQFALRPVRTIPAAIIAQESLLVATAAGTLTGMQRGDVVLIILSDDQPDEVWWQLMRSAYDWHARVLIDDRSHQFSRPILGERFSEVLTKLDLTDNVLQDALALLKWEFNDIERN